MNTGTRRLLVALALCWHLLSLAPAWSQAAKERHGRDFASYYYALQVAAEGNNPYVRQDLGAEAREDGTRGGVHPFFYPPPFLLSVAWAKPMSLSAAYQAWFWLDELCGLLTVALLARWWAPLGSSVEPALWGAFALATAVPNNHLMGQANLPVMLALIGGLALVSRGRDLPGGALVGLACMWKMSPALFVAMWLLQRRWTPAVAAVGAAVLASVLSLPLVGLSDQIWFYTRVLPGFSSGDYNGLSVGIDIWGNHSFANVYDAWLPNPDAGSMRLGATAQALTTATALALVGAVGWLFRKPAADPLAEAARIGAVGIVMLLVPVFTYEHHVIWALPALAALIVAVERGRLGAGAAVALGVSIALWAFDLAELKSAANGLDNPLVTFALREGKFSALLVILGLSVRVGARDVEGA